MLKHRIVPILLYDGSFCVQTTAFKQPGRKIGPMEQYVNNMAKRDVDELAIIDINATRCHRGPLFDKIKNMAKDQFCPVSYGGGITSLDDIKRLMSDCGVDKVIIKTSCSLIYSAARKFGSQAIVYAMDCYKHHSDGHFFIDHLPKKFRPSNWAKIIEENGAGEILLTSMDRQGIMMGYSKSLIYSVSNSVKIPVIANGGCGEPSHMVEAIKAGASAAASSSMFALRGVTPQDCARALLEAELPARVSPPTEPREASQRLPSSSPEALHGQPTNLQTS